MPRFSFRIIPRSLGGGGGGGGEVKLTPSTFLALNLCSLTNCQKLWHNCSLFVNTSFVTLSDVIGDDAIAKSHAICVLTAKSQFFARNLLNTYNFTMDST